MLELGNGSSASMFRLGATWNWQQQWFTEGNWYVSGHWELSAGQWDGHSNAGNNQTLTDLGLTPVFRLEQHQPGRAAYYFEGAIGFHLISKTFIHNNRHFSTAFQFGDHLGAGVRFGANKQFDLCYRFQHLSNGSIKKPNDGINFNQIRFAYHF